MFSVLDKVRDNKDDWRKQIERMKRGRHHLTVRKGQTRPLTSWKLTQQIERPKS
jgi:hypothetical protein